MSVMTVPVTQLTIITVFFLSCLTNYSHQRAPNGTHTWVLTTHQISPLLPLFLLVGGGNGGLIAKFGYYGYSFVISSSDN